MYTTCRKIFLKDQSFIFKMQPGEGEKQNLSSVEKSSTKYKYPKGPIETEGDILFHRGEKKTEEFEGLLKPESDKNKLLELKYNIAQVLDDLHKDAELAFNNKNYRDAMRKIQKAQLMSLAFNVITIDTFSLDDLRIKTLQKLGKPADEAKRKSLPFDYIDIETKYPTKALRFPEYQGFLDIYENAIPENKRIDNLLQKIPDYKGEDTEISKVGQNYIKALMRGALETLRMYELRTDEPLAESYAEKAKKIYDEKKAGTFEDTVFTVDDFLKLLEESGTRLAQKETYEQINNRFDFTKDDHESYRSRILGRFYGKLMIAQAMKKEGKLKDEDVKIYTDYIINMMQIYDEEIYNRRTLFFIKDVIPADDPDIYFEKRKTRM